MAVKTQQLKIYGMQQKQFEEGSLQQYNPTSRNKKNIKQPNFPPKTTRKRRRTTTKNQQKERNHKDLSRNK